MYLESFLLQRDCCVSGKHRCIETISSIGIKGLGVENSDGVTPSCALFSIKTTANSFYGLLICTIQSCTVNPHRNFELSDSVAGNKKNLLLVFS